MIRKLFVAIMLICGICNAHADIATVPYLYSYIRERWGIELPTVAATGVFDTKYLMQSIDKTNAIMNNNPGTSYATDDKYTTGGIVATDKMYDAVDTLIKPEYKFFFTPATNEYTYGFQIGAGGTFVIDWDDGEIQIIQKSDTNLTDYSHTYTDAPASAHEIKLGGRATKYGTTNADAAIRFDNGASVATDNTYALRDMRGCLGCVFSTLDDESLAWAARQPRFYRTFRSNPALTSKIPPELFKGVYGAPVDNMFAYTFAGDSNLSGGIPGDLFGGLEGAPAVHMFDNTFNGCRGLTGSIPGELFAKISGKPQHGMFSRLVGGCSGLTGDIPNDLFRGIYGAPATEMFLATFSGCSQLTGVPDDLFSRIDGKPQSNMFAGVFGSCKGLSGIGENLFGNISGPAIANMFGNAFSGCTGLRGPSATVRRDDGTREFLYERWPEFGGDCYSKSDGLADWDDIPTTWGGPRVLDSE